MFLYILIKIVAHIRFPLQTSLASRSTGSDTGIPTNHEENYQKRAVYSKSIFK